MKRRTEERRPLKKWRCCRCWRRFGRPREERRPLCRDCRAGQVLLFGERSLLPAGVIPR